MRRAYWAVLSVVVLLGALLACVWLVPPMLDWTRFRPEIEAFASDALGRRVGIDGKVALTLLPQPSFTAAGISIAGAPDTGAGGGRMTAAQLRLAVTLRGLFSGRIEAQEVVLRGVELNLPWPPPADALVFRPPSWLSALSARVEGGTVTIGGVVAKLADATLSTVEGTGTYNVAGSATISGRNWRIAAQLSRPGGDGSAALTLSLDGQGPAQGLGLALSGQISGEGAFAGRINLRGGDLSLLLPAPAMPFRAEGRLNVAGGLAVADELNGELGGAPLRGAVAFRLSPVPRLDLALTASRLDLDAWWTALLRQSDADASTRSARDVLPDFAIGIDLSAEVAQFAGGAVRGIRAAFDLSGGMAELRELRATLPGEASVRAAGRFTLPSPKRAAAGKLRFDGYVAATALAPRTSLAWLLGPGFDPAAMLPGGVLRQADLAGHVVYEPGQLALDGIVGNIDDTAVAGAASLRSAARPVVTAELKLGHVDLDPFLSAAPPVWTAAWLAGFDATLKLEAASVRAAGIALDNVAVDGALEQGRVNLRRFTMALGGIELTASGAVQEGGRLADGRLTLHVPENGLRNAVFAPYWPAALLRAIPQQSAIWQSPVTLQVDATGTPAALGLKVQAELGDLRAEFLPMVDLPAGRWAGSLTLRHPGAPRLAEAMGLAGATAWLGDGSLGLVTQLSGQAGRLAADGFDLAAGSLHANGSLVLATTETGQAVTGRVKLETLPLPLPHLRSPLPLPWFDMAGWAAAVQIEAGQVLLGQTPVLGQAQANLSLAGGVLRLDGLTATLGGGTLTGELGFDSLAEPPKLTLRGELRGAALAGPLFELPFDLNAGVLDATAALTATGHAPAALLATLGGTLQVTGRDGVVAGLALGRLGGRMEESELRAGLAEGTTGFDRLTLDTAIDHGVVTLREARLAGRDGGVAATGSLDLPAGTASLHFDLRPAMPDPPVLGLRVDGKLAAPERVPELSDVIRWRAEHPVLP
jgi:hypothetical protein